MKILRDLYDGGGFKSGCDYPTALFVDDLVDMFPEAKVSSICSLLLQPCSHLPVHSWDSIFGSGMAYVGQRNSCTDAKPYSILRLLSSSAN